MVKRYVKKIFKLIRPRKLIYETFWTLGKLIIPKINLTRVYMSIGHKDIPAGRFVIQN